MAKREIPAKTEIVCDVCAAECVGGNYQQSGVVNVELDPPVGGPATYKANGSCVLYLCDECLTQMNAIIVKAQSLGGFTEPPKGKK